MRIAFIIFLMLASGELSRAQLSGFLSDTLGPGQYSVIDTISINIADTLVLLPGTTFLFDGPYPFEIEGMLLAEGSENDSILFTTDTLTNPGRWRGLRFTNPTCSGSRLSFCRIENALADDGGGIHCEYASPAFEYCSIHNNEANEGGGGLFLLYASPTFHQCRIYNNTAAHAGGIECNHASPTFTSCAIHNNTANAQAGGVECRENSSPTFTTCTFTDNMAYNGGAIFCAESSSPGLINCTLSGNTADFIGGGVFCYQCSLDFNSTIIAFSNGAGIHFDNCDGSEVQYCDFFGNTIPFDGGIPNGLGYINSTNNNGDSCDIYNNIFFDPSFVDTAASDFHLLEISPCIDAGDSLLPFDPDCSFADIGAFYYGRLLIVPADYDFDSVGVNEDSSSNLWIHNRTNGDLVIQSITTDDNAFSHNWNPLDSLLNFGDSLQISVIFAPDSCREYAATLSIETDGPNGYALLIGTGLGAYITVEPAAYDFGVSEPGFAETLAVAMINQGNIALSISEFTDCPPSFTALPDADSIVATQDTGWVNIVFEPPDVGSFLCDFGIVSNAFNEDTARASLSGEGVLIPSPVGDLTIAVQGADAALCWSPVYTTIHGNPMEADAYLVFHSDSAEGSFLFLGFTTDTCYTHGHVCQFNDAMFYEVTAYVGSVELLPPTNQRRFQKGLRVSRRCDM